MNKICEVPKKGRIIVLEGIDGCGKGTQLSLLQKRLLSREVPVVVSREPGGTYLGEEMRRLMFEKPTTHKMAPNVVTLCMLAAHLQHVHEVVLPSLAAGMIVVLDRYWHSQFAYAPFRQEHPVMECAYKTLHGPECDLIFVYEGDPEVLLSRAFARPDLKEQAKRWATVDAQRRTASEYHHVLVDHPNARFVDVTNRTPEQIFEEDTWPPVDELLGDWWRKAA